MKKYGLLGKNLKFSESPRFHELFFEEMKIKGSYEIFDSKEHSSTEEEEEKYMLSILEKIKSGELDGINVTSPYKEMVIKYMDKITDEAIKSEAVNCIKLENSELVGYNTDVFGAEGLLIGRNKYKMSGKKVYILGTGGAAKAVEVVVREYKGEPIFVSREPKKDRNKQLVLKDTEINIEETALKREIIGYDTLKSIKKKEKFLINATPLGNMYDRRIAPISFEIGRKFERIIDLNYTPSMTKLMSYVADNDNGLWMLVAQGVKSQEIWRGEPLVKDGDCLDIYLAEEKLMSKIYLVLKKEIYQKYE